MQNILNRIPDEKVPGRWITTFPVGLGEYSLRENWSLLSRRAFHLSSSVLAKAINKKRNGTGSILSPCFTPTLRSMGVSTLPMMI